jgi:hypothetical protein
MMSTPPTGIEMWTIYWSPRDYPNCWVVRRFVGLLPDPIGAICQTLESAREQVPDHCVCLHRAPDDDPAIYEVWL